MRVERFELSATAWKAVNLTINRYPQRKHILLFKIIQYYIRDPSLGLKKGQLAQLVERIINVAEFPSGGSIP